VTPAARVQAAIEILDTVIAGAVSEGAPADRIISDYFRTRRYAGSKDRRAVRELVYNVIRAVGEVPPDGRAAMIAYGSAPDNEHILQCFDGSTHGPAPLESGPVLAEAGLMPAWLLDALAASEVSQAVVESLIGRAPLDVRVNTLKAERATIALPEQGELVPSSQGLRFAAGTPVEGWPAFVEGAIEVQDLGSQLIIDALPATPGECVIDLCAGAGGKALAFAAKMGNLGTLLACDTDRTRLSRLQPRATRAGASVIESRLVGPKRELESLPEFVGKADLVLVDAPCSGTGTLRRKPEAKWRLSPALLARYVALQDHLLGVAAQLVAPGGYLAFVTCSLLDAEGSDRVSAFLAANPDWQAGGLDLPGGEERGAGYRLDPVSTGSDGFFVAMLKAPC
jgi:16S rRNA (cytosine967-C5)-methyltransferase